MNKRIVYYEVEHCIQCPFIESDINITRYGCKKTGKMICWMGVGRMMQRGFLIGVLYPNLIRSNTKMRRIK